jgi:NADPH:quinone reductase-like Zn-dependent oxidoreductase
MGATVTGVCSTRNVERVLALGADRVIDYTLSDYTAGDEAYDLVVDLVGNHSVQANRRVLADGGRMVIVAGGQGDWLGPLKNPIMAALLSPFVEQEFITLLAHLGKPDLEALAAMMAAGKLRPVIDRHYPLAKVAEAIAYSETGRAQGKIIVDID